MGKRKNATVASKKKEPTEVFPANLLGYRRDVAKQLIVETLHEKAIHVVRNFFSAQECQAWVDYTATSSNNSDCVYVSHPATRYVAHRECFRLQRPNDWGMAHKIFERMKPIIDQLDFGFDDHGGYQPITCNGNLRLYKYEKGMRFGRHIDESNDTERGRTEVTVLIYLSVCQGGATRFHLPHKKKQGSASVAFEPEPGAVLFHVHGDKCLEHEADAVTGGAKYILRTDLVYSRR